MYTLLRPCVQNYFINFFLNSKAAKAAFFLQKRKIIGIIYIVNLSVGGEDPLVPQKG